MSANVIRGAPLVAATLVAAGCASSAPARGVQTSVRVDPVTAPVTQQATGTNKNAPPPALPQLSGTAAPVLSGAPERRVTSIDVPAGTPIGVALSQLGSKF